ncbi:MAG: ATPase, partial [Clostridia bacterium]|nr:ATPase [Clostridia bacterium]
MRTHLGIELGSTRIKAVCIDDSFNTLSQGDYTWASKLENGVWTYDLDEAMAGIKKALSAIENRESIASVGISGMMHGYLAFDENWNLLVPFRAWQNTSTKKAAAMLTELFGFNIPQRWSIAHLCEALLKGEEHVGKVAHITTLAGYIHHALTGVNAVGIGEASGIFPIDKSSLYYDEEMLDKFASLEIAKKLKYGIRDILPSVLPAGKEGGRLTKEGSLLIDSLLPESLLFAPPEGDAGTGMVATNAVRPRTGNISAGTSIFSMTVLEENLKEVHEEIDVVTTPSGDPVAMVHCNNCTNESNNWAKLFSEASALFGASPSTEELYTKLYEKSLEGDDDCGGITVCNYLAGEGVTHIDSGMPMITRNPESPLTLANLFKAQLYSSMATLKIGMDILFSENISLDSFVGHGGLFKTKG